MTSADTAARTPLGTAEFDAIRAVVERESAIQIADGQDYLVESRLKPLLTSGAFGSFTALVAALSRGDRSAIAATIDAMTTNETLFFRDLLPFDTLGDEIVPELLRTNHGQIVIWSAACSSGQEPYSLAMLLSERFPAQVDRFRIVATDISPSMISRCEMGRYSQFEVNRGLASSALAKHFDREGREWVVKPALRRMVEFRQHNLVGPWAGLPTADVVLLRNVLIYFTPEVKTRILAKVRTDVLKRRGVLLLGSSETTLNLDDTYERETRGNFVFYRAP